MNGDTRNAYRWDGTQIDVARQNEEQLDRLLRKARARNAPSHASEGPSVEKGSGVDAFMWRPHFDVGANAHGQRRTAKPRPGTWLMRSVLGLLLLMMTGVAFLPFGAEVAKIVAAVL